MMSYLRWHQDDVDDITPSLWANRNRKSRAMHDDVGFDGGDERGVDAARPRLVEKPCYFARVWMLRPAG